MVKDDAGWCDKLAAIATNCPCSSNGQYDPIYALVALCGPD
jgi:hypothetical protein